MRRQKQVLIVLGVLVVAVATERVLRRAGTDDASELALRPEQEVHEGKPSRALTPAYQGGVEAARAPAAGGADAPLSSRSFRVVGRTVSADDGGPVRASVAIDDATTWSSAFTGQFSVVIPEASTITATVSAPGFAQQRLERQVTGSMIDLGEVVLSAARVRSIEVVGIDGRGIAGAEVWRADLAEPSAGTSVRRWRGTGEALVGETDAAGVVPVELVGDAVVFARLGDRCSLPQTWPGTSDALIVVLPDVHSAKLGLCDTLGEPVPGVTLCLTGFNHRPVCTFRRTTGPDGYINEGVPPGRYQIQLSLDRFQFTESSRSTSPYLATVDLSGSEPVWLHLDVFEARYVDVRDAETRAPLGPLTVWLGFYRPDGPPGPLQQGDWRPIFAPDVLDGSRVALQPYIREHQTENPNMYRLFVRAPGYQQGFVESPLSTIAPGTPYELLLEQLPLRTLRFLTPSGEPHTSRVALYEGGEWRREARPDVSGDVQFGWSGGEVVVCAAKGKLKHINLATVSAESLRVEPVVVVELGTPGTLVVEIPEGERGDHLVCFREDGVPYAGVLRGSELVFPDLLPGDYEVGPVEMLDSLQWRLKGDYGALPIELLPGETRRVEWEAGWHLVETLSGAVTATGVDLEELWVVPRYASKSLAMNRMIDRRHYKVDASGNFQIDGITTAPTNLVFVRADDNGKSVPVGVGDPGVVARVECSTPSISIPGVADGIEVLVKFQPRFEGAWGGVPKYTVVGVTGVPLTLGPVPLRTSVWVSCLAAGPPVDVELNLEPGENRVVEVEIGSDAPRSAASRGD